MKNKIFELYKPASLENFLEFHKSNPKERFVYVGYDAWNIFRTSFNPIGPMMTQTYITPQTVTGSIVKNNLNVVLPPNFPQTIYFKNQAYIMPNNANLFIS